MSNFGFFTACWSLFKSLVNSCFSLLIFFFPRQWILIQIPIDREILRLFQFASRHHKRWNTVALSVHVNLLNWHFIYWVSLNVNFGTRNVSFSFPGSWIRSCLWPVWNLSFTFFLLQGKIDRRWVLLRFSPPSQWAEQIRVLSQFRFKLSFRSKRTYSRPIRLALGIR